MMYDEWNLQFIIKTIFEKRVFFLQKVRQYTSVALKRQYQPKHLFQTILKNLYSMKLWNESVAENTP